MVITRRSQKDDKLVLPFTTLFLTTRAENSRVHG